MWTTCVVLLALVARTYAGPINFRNDKFGNSVSCAVYCPDSSKFQYLTGTTYQYDYSVQVDTTMENAYEDKATLQIAAVVNVEVLARCDFAMTLRHVKIVHSSNEEIHLSPHFKMSLEKRPLRFSFHDGEISHVCPAEDEEKWVLNFKRGVLSTIQNTMDHLERDQKTKETDVTGRCSTEYTVTNRGWYSTTVKKSKDLIGCNDRHGYQSSIHAMPYSTSSKIQSLPLMKSTHECEQELDKSGFLKSATCQEVHVFRPFSKENSGAVTKVSQKLINTGQIESVSVTQGMIKKRVTLLYEHERLTTSDDHRRSFVSKLEEICTATREDIQPDVPGLFSQLVSIMKNLDSDTIRDIYSQISDKTICQDNNIRTKQFFLDAIPMAGTASAIRILKEMIINKEVTDHVEKMWIMSLAFVQDPCYAVLMAATDLLNNPPTSFQSMLPVSTLVNNYCKQYQPCENDKPVMDIVNSLLKHIEPGCAVHSSNRANVLQALRALGNIGHVLTITRSVSQCFVMTMNPAEVKVAALQAYRRLPCTADRSDAMNVFTDSSLDSEVRIEAYLAIMQCPDEDVVEVITLALTRETDKQVGSFVWSHLTNLVESSSPHKKHFKSILKDETLLKEFDLEKMKYSHNYEGSVFIDKFNTGALADGNLIWSGKSFIPRSAMVNITVDLFGNSVNLFEIGGRMEGLDYLLETYLGPYGYFSEKKTKRNSDQSKLGLDELKASGYMRMFGNELSFLRMHGVDELKGFNFLKFLIDLSTDHDYSFTQSILFLDSSLIIPTGCGLPLNLTVNGAATVDLKANGKIDLRKVHTSPRSLLVEGLFQPSGSVQMKGIMSVDAIVTKIGMKVVNTWHSSTALRGRIELNRGRVFSVKFDMPQDKIEILDVKTSFFRLHGHSENAQKMLQQHEKNINVCSGSGLARVTGLELCVDVSYVNASQVEHAPYFPFTGPFDMEISLNKRDKHSGYNMLVKRTETKTASTIQFAFDTPGARIDRTLAFDLSVNYKKKQVDLSFVSPWKNIAVKSSVMNNKTNVGMSGSILIDDTKEMGFNAQVLSTKKKSLVTYTPSLEIRRLNKDNIVFSGLVVINGRRTGDLDLVLTGISNDTITLKTTLTNTKTEKSFKGVFGLCPKRKYSADIGIILQDNSNKRTMFKVIPTFVIRNPTTTLISLTGSADFKQDKSLKSSMSLSIAKYMNKPATIKCNWRKMSGKRLRHSAVLIFTSKYASVKMTGLFDKKTKGSASRLTVDYSLPVLKRDSKNRIAFSTKFTERSTKTLFKQKYNVNLDVKRNPELNFDTSVDLSHNRRVTDLSFKMQYGENYKDVSKKINALAVIRHKLFKSLASISYQLKTQWPALNLNAQVKGNHKHDRKYLKSTITAKCGKGKNFDASLDLKDLSRKLVKKTIEFKCRYPGNDINFHSSLSQMSQSHYQHNANLKIGKSKTSTMTVYRHQQKSKAYELSSDITVHNMKPVHLSGMVDLNRYDFKASGQVATRGKIYSIKSLYKYSIDSATKCMLDVAYPDRHITVDLEGKKDTSNLYETKLDAKWDADNDPKQNIHFDSKINLTSLYDMESAMTLRYPERTVSLNVKTFNHMTHLDCSWHPSKMVSVDTTWKYDNTYPGITLGTSLNLKTPFTVIEDLNMKVDIINSKQKLTSSVVTAVNNQSHHFSMDLTVQKPVSFNKAAFIINTVSSVKGVKNASLSIAYDLSDTLNCNILGTLEKTETELSIVGKAKRYSMLTDIEGIIVFNSNIPYYEKCKLTLNHSDDRRKFTTNLALQINTEQWISDLNMNHSLMDWNLRNSGKLIFSSPHKRIISSWNHANTLENTKTQITSDWGNNRFYLELSGDHSVDSRIKSVGKLQVHTPWTNMNHLEVYIHNEFGDGFLHAISTVKNEGENKFVTDIYYLRSDEHIDCNIDMMIPYHDNIAMKLNTRYKVYPVTGHMELEWASKKRVTADGSLAMQSLSDFSANVRMTTPLKGYKTIIMKATNTKQGTEWISRSSIEYGTRKSLKMEARIQFENRKKFWMKVETPFKNYKKMHTGIQYELNPYQFSGKVELVGNPVIGKYTGLLNWDAKKEFSCKCRLDTPLKVFPYFEMIAKSTKGRKGKSSRIQIEYSPKKSLIFTSTYKFTGPLLLDVSVSTPYEKYKRITLYFKHTFGRQRFTTHVEASKLTDKLSGDIKFRWNKDIDGILLIKTPFEGYRSSKISIRHNGKLLNFKNQCNVEIYGEKLIETAIEFIHNQKTSGAISIKSSKFDDIKISFDHKGGLVKYIGSVSLFHGGVPVLDISLQNQYKPNTLDTELNMRSAHFEDIKLTLDHLGNFQRFSTKLAGSMGNNNNFLLDTKFHQTKPVTDFSTRLTYTIDKQASNVGAQLFKDGNLRNLMTKLSGNINKQFVNVKTVLMTESSVDADVTIQTSIKDFENIGISVQHSGQIDNFVAENTIQYMNDKYIQTRILFKTTGPKELSIKAEIETPFEAYRHIVIYHDHEIKRRLFTSKSGFNGNQIKTEATVKHSDLKHTQAMVTIETPFEGYTKSIFQHYHILAAESFTSSTGYNKHVIGTKINFPHFETKNVDMMIEVTTPFKGYEQSVVNHKHQLQGTMFTSNSQFNEQSFTCAISCTHYTAKHVETKIEIHTPIAGYSDIIFLHKHHLSSNSMIFISEVNYGDGEKGVNISVHLEPNVKINAAIQTPFTYFQDANISVDQSNGRIASTVGVQYRGGQSIEGSAVIYVSESGIIESQVTLLTPFKGYEKTKGTFMYQITRNSLSIKVKCIYGNEKTIIAELNGLNVEAIKFSIIVKTPVPGFETSRFLFSHKGTVYNFKCHHETELAGKTVHTDLSVQHDVSTIVNWNITTNSPMLKQAKLYIVKHGSYRSMELNAGATLNDIFMKGQITTRVEKAICAASMSFSSPFTQNIIVNAEHSRRPTGFTTKITTDLGHDKHVSTFINFIKHGTMVDLNSEMTYVWIRSGNHVTFGFHKEGELNNIVVNMNGKYDSKVIEMSAELKTISGIHGKVYFKTPFEKYHSIGMSVDHSGSSNNFASEGRIKYMDEKEIFVKFNHFQKMWKRMETTAEVHLPIPNFEYTKMSYRHSSTDDSISCITELSYGPGQRFSTDFQLSLTPKFDMAFLVESTIPDYEVLELLTSYEGTYQRYMLDTSLNVGKGRKYIVISILDYSEMPISTSFRISTPILGFETIEFTATHIGEVGNFRSTAAFKSPYTASIVGEATLKYQSIVQFDHVVALTSEIENMKILKFITRLTDDGGQYRSHIEIMWDPEKSIVFKEVYKYENTWDGDHLISEFELTTPFTVIKQSALKIEHIRTTDKYNEKYEAEYNNKPLLDLDVEYSTGPRHDASISTKHPRPMSLTVIGYKTKNNMNSEIILNWNKQNPNSNLHAQMMYMWGDNKDVEFKLIRPSRTIGFVGSLKHLEQQTECHGEVIWNEEKGHKLTYGFNLNDNSRRQSTMYDGSLELGLPIKTVRVTGAYSDNSQIQTVDGSLYWDLDDPSKEVSMRTVLYLQSPTKRADVTFHLPSIEKDIRIGTEMTLNEGRTLFLGKTEISYSEDSRKMLTLMTSLEDTSSSDLSTNYSFILGVRHPFTDVAATFTSHTGYSANRCSSSINLNYLTAKKEIQNFALMMEIDKLKNQMDLQLVTPVKKLNITADVDTTNPYHIGIKNSYDNTKTVSTNLTLNTDSRTIDLRIAYDLANSNQLVQLTGRYVNNSAIHVDLYHGDGLNRVLDGVMAVRLNTSRLLHARLHWRPSMLSEIETLLATECSAYCERITMALIEMSDSLGAELSSKYRRITMSMSEESKPFIALLDSELVSIDRQLDDFRRILSVMYQTNEFFIQDIGQSYQSFIDYYSRVAGYYRENYGRVTHSMSKFLNEMATFPMNDKYQMFVNSLVTKTQTSLYKLLSMLNDAVKTLDVAVKDLQTQTTDKYTAVQEKLSKLIKQAKNHAKVNEFRKTFDTTDYRTFLMSVAKRTAEGIRTSGIADKYTTAATRVQGMVNTGLHLALGNEDYKELDTYRNNVYQEMLWAYKYWEMETNLAKHFTSLLDTLEEVLQEEMEEYTTHLYWLQSSNVTVYDPKNGEIQMEVYLPFPVNSLNTLPGFQAYFNRINSYTNYYVDKIQTMEKLYESYFVRPKYYNTEPKDDFNQELKAYLNAPQKRRILKRYEARKM